MKTSRLIILFVIATMLLPACISAATPASISTRVSPKDSMVQVFVPTGSFQMGSNHGHPSVIPAHMVKLDAFWIDQTEVTNEQYDKCVSAGVCQRQLSNSIDDGNFNGRQQPVVRVNWFDAEKYCEWAGRRLPTEAEWEKAARGTDERTYPWGSQQPKKSKANYGNNVRKTTDVGSYSPEGDSPYGAQDMAGNVWEWVADWYDETYYKDSPASNPTGPATGKERGLRGGSWFSLAGEVSSVVRLGDNPDYWYYYFGLRCASSS